MPESSSDRIRLLKRSMSSFAQSTWTRKPLDALTVCDTELGKEGLLFDNVREGGDEKDVFQYCFRNDLANALAEGPEPEHRGLASSNELPDAVRQGRPDDQLEDREQKLGRQVLQPGHGCWRQTACGSVSDRRPNLEVTLEFRREMGEGGLRDTKSEERLLVGRHCAMTMLQGHCLLASCRSQSPVPQIFAAGCDRRCHERKLPRERLPTCVCSW
jgi:hypothetical protein